MVTGHREVVAVVQLVGGGRLDLEVGLSHVGQSSLAVVGQTADPGPGVSPVVGDTAVVGDVLTQPLAVLDALHVVVDTVHRLEQDPQPGLVLAHSDLAPGAAVVLQVDHLPGTQEAAGLHRVPVRLGQAAPGAGGVVVERPAGGGGEQTIKEKEILLSIILATVASNYGIVTLLDSSNTTRAI